MNDYIEFINNQSLDYLYKYGSNGYEFDINDGEIVAYRQL